MFWKATKSQTIFLLEKKETVLAFLILMSMIFSNFSSNVLTFQGRDVTQMYQPMKLLLISYNRINFNIDATLLLIQLYPLLVVYPAGFSLAKENQLGEDVYMISRLGKRVYIFSKLLAVFSVTAIVFSAPFLIEIVLNCLAFPMNATGDLSNLNAYDLSYIKSTQNYFMAGIYQYSSYLYAIVGVIIWGLVSGMLGVFTMAISSIIKIRYNICLFLPVFVLLNLTVIVAPQCRSIDYSIRWYDYLLIFNDQPKNIKVFVSGILILFLLSFVFSLTSIRKDRL